MNPSQNRRILLVDDMPSIHQDFSKILTPPSVAHSDLAAIRSALFGAPDQPHEPSFELDSAYQGQEGLAKVCAAMMEGRPYALAFIDMRMPPGWDGVETIKHIWQQDPKLQVVICTAYSDHAWDSLLEQLDARDRLLILKKPFDNIEVLQLAHTLTAKWNLTEQAALQMSRLEETVQERTREISRANQALEAEIAERKNLESQLVQAEKLASIGQLAAGVAHEINNPIGYVFSNFSTLEGYIGSLFEMLASYEDAEPAIGSPDVASGIRKLRERLEIEFLREDIPTLMRESKEGIARVRKIVQDLKDFSRVDSSHELQWANLHQGIDSTLNILANEIKYRADVVKEYGDIPEVECQPSQINQVVMNLVINAVHAMGDGQRGRITIRTGREGGNAWIEVADTGSGIPPDVLPRIFDPFFTTKPIGKGTGLGLSLTYGIVQKHGGHIGVQSEVGKGTTFRITLPIQHEEAEEAGSSPPSPTHSLAS